MGGRGWWKNWPTAGDGIQEGLNQEGLDSPWRRYFGGLRWRLRWSVMHVKNPQHNSYYVEGSCRVVLSH